MTNTPKIDNGKVALSLCGGGSRGIVQVGMIKAWLELGLSYDSLFGVSVGALNGTLLHQGSDIEELEHLWLNIKTDDVYTLNLGGLALKQLGAKSVYNSDPLERTIRKVLKYDKLMANPKPFYINAADYTNWTDWQLDSKQLVTQNDYVKFLLASASPPVLFPPVTIDDKILCDGGTVNNFNLTAAIQKNHDTVILMSPTNVVRTKHKPTILEMIKGVTTIPSFAFLEREQGGINAINKIINTINEPLFQIDQDGDLVVMGSHTIYVLSGSYRGFKEGTCFDIATGEPHTFLILKLLQDNPGLRNPATLKAAKKQMVELTRNKSELLLKEVLNEEGRNLLSP